METRIPASERTSQKLKELLTQGVAEGDARSELIKLAVRKIVEEVLEAEVAEAVGRGYYESCAVPGAGYRNGYRRGRLRTAEGAIDYGVPQVADRAEPFVSRVRAGLAGRTAEVEQLAVEMYARGLSTQDIEAAFRDASDASLLSRTAVSQVTERLWQEYEAFAGRDLSEFAVAYFFVDGVAERLHAGLPREAVLCAWGITEDGRKVLLHLAPGTKEDTASCTAFFEDLKRRGLADPHAGDRHQVLRRGVGQRDLRQVTVDSGEVLAAMVQLPQDALDRYPFIGRQRLRRQPAPALTTEQSVAGQRGSRLRCRIAWMRFFKRVRCCTMVARRATWRRICSVSSSGLQTSGRKPEACKRAKTAASILSVLTLASAMARVCSGFETTTRRTYARRSRAIAWVLHVASRTTSSS